MNIKLYFYLAHFESIPTEDIQKSFYQKKVLLKSESIYHFSGLNVASDW
ncbi:hypothetical protein CLW00_11091 [Mongoliibacter ruber]|uniref:Uncharacterized protein n=1 Tax=Mongoliibacter ruber TaxID=1750599 RepID=A0A2T0WGW9_9BACT|nr:hypothetical protein CLW00_11091 [Mongoliibacter ruber]